MPHSSATPNATKNIRSRHIDVTHRHFRLSAHPPHHEHYHNILLIVILLVVLFGVSAIVDDSPLRLQGVGSKGGESPKFEAQTLDVPVSNQVYELSVKSVLGNALAGVEVSEGSLAEALRAKKALMDTVVPKKHLDVHLGLVLLLSRKADVIKKSLEGEGDRELDKLSSDLEAFQESYQWLKR